MKHNRVTRCLFILVLLVTTLGCNLTDIIRGGQAEEEPESPLVMYVTATPGAAAAPLPAAAPTQEPYTGLSVLPCASPPGDCPEAVNARDFYEIKKPPFIYSFDIPVDTRLFVSTGWSAIDMATLEQNLPYIDFYLEIDGLDYYSELYTTKVEEPDADDPSKMNGLFHLNVVVSGWQAHLPNTIRIGYVVTAPLNDGWDDYDTGFELERVLLICPGGDCVDQ